MTENEVPERIYIDPIIYKLGNIVESGTYTTERIDVDDIEYILKSVANKKIKQLEYALHCEISRTKWVKNMFGIEKPILDSPCIFCGYNGQGYWQVGTHDKKCPWHRWGGEAERNDMLPDIIRKLYISDKKAGYFKNKAKFYKELVENIMDRYNRGGTMPVFTEIEEIENE